MSKLKKAGMLIVATVALSGTAAPLSARVGICDIKSESFEVWFIQKFYCR